MRLFLSAGIIVMSGLAVFAQEVTPTLPNPAELQALHAEPGVEYGPAGDFSLPKTILFSASPEEILADAEEWARHGVTAFFMDYVARDWSSDIWSADNAPWTIGASDETFQKATAANEVCRRIGSETFLKVAFDHYFEWFNDQAWEQAYHNFRQFAVFARDTGCTGIALDIEYIFKQYYFDWEGYDYQGYGRPDLAAKIRERMTRVISILYDTFPEMVFLTFPEQTLGLGQHIHAAWLEEAARRKAPGGIHICSEYTYRRANVRTVFAHAWTYNRLFEQVLSPGAWFYWRSHCSIAAGVWPFGFDHQEVHSPGMTLEDLRQGFAASLMVSSRYNWIYSHNCREQLIGRGREAFPADQNLDEYLSIFTEREIITTPKYLSLAQELRAKTRRDYSTDLELIPQVSFAGPLDAPMLRLLATGTGRPEEYEPLWKAALQYFQGGQPDLCGQFGTHKEWMIIGPFPSEGALGGHNTAYPPEAAIDLAAEYDGLNGKVRWQACRQEGPFASVDLTKCIQPSEQVCAYALCFVTSPASQPVQMRIGTNDSGKVWLNGKLIYDYPEEGVALLDRDAIPVTLPAGTSPVLIKVCNNRLNWGFVFRITDPEGRPLKDLEYSLSPNR